MPVRGVERQWIHGLLGVALGLLCLVLLPNTRFVERTTDIWGDILRPLEYPAVFFRMSLKKNYFWFSDRRRLNAELLREREENRVLRMAVSMKKAEDIRDDIIKDRVSTRITLRPPRSWWSEIRVDRGSSNGVLLGMPVLQNGVLVGRVLRGDVSSSWIHLITSPDLLIPVVVDDTRDLGVIRGDGKGNIWLMYVPEGSDISVGMSISTALVGDMFPAGIPVGKVSEEGREQSGGFREYRILSDAALSRLDKVVILQGWTR